MKAPITCIHNGTDTKNFHNVPPNSHIELSGLGFITVRGNVGAGSTFIVKGFGDLRILGEVAPDVKFHIGKVSKVVFAKRPPQSVVDAIQIEELGSYFLPPKNMTLPANIEINGNIVAITTNHVKCYYQGNIVAFADDKIFLDGYELQKKDPREVPAPTTHQLGFFKRSDDTSADVPKNQSGSKHAIVKRF